MKQLGVGLRFVFLIDPYTITMRFLHPILKMQVLVFVWRDLLRECFVSQRV